jgi:uncharacterized protein (TIGR02266 family)
VTGDSGRRAEREARLPSDGVVRLFCPDRRGVQSGFLRDVSPGGMFLRLVDPEPVGSRLGFELSLPGCRQRVRGTGEVAWAREAYGGPGRPPGMAVRFLALEPEGAKALAELLGTPPRAEVLRVTSPAAAREAAEAFFLHGAVTSAVETASGEENVWSSEPTCALPDGVTSSGSDAPKPFVGRSGGLADDPAGTHFEDAPGGPGSAPVVGEPATATATAEAGETAEAAVVDPGLGTTEGFVGAPAGGAADGDRVIPRYRPLAAAAAVTLAVAVIAAVGWWRLGVGARSAPGPAELPASPNGVAPPPPAPRAVPAVPGPSGQQVRPAPAAGSSPGPAGLAAPVAAPQAGTPLPAATRLVDVRWEVDPAGGTLVFLRFDGALDPSRRVSSRIGGEAPRHVLQLAGARGTRPGEAQWEVGTPELRRVRTGYHPGDGGGALHVVFDLGGPGVALTTLEVVGDTLRCRVSIP